MQWGGFSPDPAHLVGGSWRGGIKERRAEMGRVGNKEGQTQHRLDEGWKRVTIRLF